MSPEVVAPPLDGSSQPTEIVTGTEDEGGYRDAVTYEDAEFIAHAYTDVGDLADEVDRLRREAGRVEQCETSIVAILEAERDTARLEVAALRSSVEAAVATDRDRIGIPGGARVVFLRGDLRIALAAPTDDAATTVDLTEGQRL
jgi:hypothetical protein